MENAKIRDNTIIIWTTDNGTARKIEGSYRGTNVKGTKALTTEPGICAPFIVSWPDHLEVGIESDALIDFTDIYPTCREVAGIEPQNNMNTDSSSHVIDEKSFLSVLLDQDEASEREWILGMGGGDNARLTENGVENQYNFSDRVIRNKQYKLYIGSNRKAQKFIDLLVDPFERHNLLDSIITPDQQ